MDTLWLRNIKGTRQLSVFPGTTLTPAWARVFPTALQAFNQLSNSLTLGVTLTQAALAPTRFLTGANIQFEATDGALTFESFAGSVTLTIAGSGTSGKTAAVPSPSNGGRLGQAFICVPKSPQVLAPGPTLREAGDPIKLVIAVHELIHACGLDKHTSFGDPDLFVGVLSDVPDSDPAKDQEDVGSGKKVPPLFLSAETVARIQSLWLMPSPIIHFPLRF